MKQKITFLFFAIFTLVLSAQTVSIQGGSSYGTITEAIAASTDGDVILITGIHTESISISKSITLRGTDPTTDIIQAASAAASDGTGSSVISISRVATEDLNITIENLGIRYGNSSTNGGGINVDKVTGLLTLKNLIIANNYSTANGGGLSLAGTNANITGCTINTNTSALDGAGIIAAPNNAVSNSVVNIKQSLINGNTGRNGGGIYINGNNNFGNNNKIDVLVENSTISNNITVSPSSGNGGGGILSLSFLWVGNGIGNVTLSLVHATVYNNDHASLTKDGLQFAGTNTTNFSAYNSIIVDADDLGEKALNFANTNTTNVVNCILGGLNVAPVLIDDVAKNNLKGKTATQAGLATGALTSEGGNTQVIVIEAASNAENFCTAATGITIPTIDQRGYTRPGVNDAGAYELGGTLSTGNDITNNSSVRIFPNPAQEFVKISGVNNIKLVKVYSMLGTLEKEIRNQNEFKVSDLSSGIHVMIIESDGQKTIKRVIIE